MADSVLGPWNLQAAETERGSAERAVDAVMKAAAAVPAEAGRVPSAKDAMAAADGASAREADREAVVERARVDAK